MFDSLAILVLSQVGRHKPLSDPEIVGIKGERFVQKRQSLGVQLQLFNGEICSSKRWFGGVA